jgi:hypothetical protein
MGHRTGSLRDQRSYKKYELFESVKVSKAVIMDCVPLPRCEPDAVLLLHQ